MNGQRGTRKQRKPLLQRERGGMGLVLAGVVVVLALVAGFTGGGAIDAATVEWVVEVVVTAAAGLLSLFLPRE